MCGDREGGCAECEDGQVTVSQCPLEVVGQEVWDVMRLARLYRRGLPPVFGGSLDQAAAFVDAADFIFAEEAAHRAALRLNPEDADG